MLASKLFVTDLGQVAVQVVNMCLILLARPEIVEIRLVRLELLGGSPFGVHGGINDVMCQYVTHY